MILRVLLVYPHALIHYAIKYGRTLMKAYTIETIEEIERLRDTQVMFNPVTITVEITVATSANATLFEMFRITKFSFN